MSWSPRCKTVLADDKNRRLCCQKPYHCHNLAPKKISAWFLKTLVDRISKISPEGGHFILVFTGLKPETVDVEWGLKLEGLTGTSHRYICSLNSVHQNLIVYQDVLGSFCRPEFCDFMLFEHYGALGWFKFTDIWYLVTCDLARIHRRKNSWDRWFEYSYAE